MGAWLTVSLPSDLTNLNENPLKMLVERILWSFPILDKVRVSQLLLPPSNFKKSWGHGYQLVSSLPLPLTHPHALFGFLTLERNNFKIKKKKNVLPYWPHHLWIACHVLVRSIGLVQFGYSISQSKWFGSDSSIFCITCLLSWLSLGWSTQPFINWSPTPLPSLPKLYLGWWVLIHIDREMMVITGNPDISRLLLGF